MTTKCSSFSCLAASLSSPFQRRRSAQLSLSRRLFENQHNSAQQRIYTKDKSWQFIHGMMKLKGRFQKQQSVIFVVSEDQSEYSELETDDLEPENDTYFEETLLASNSSFHLSGGDGKPGLISFYNRPYRRNSEMPKSNTERSQNSILWFMGPAVLVASFIFPSLYLRRLLSVIFEDSLLTDFLILFFTEAIFYSGVAVFLCLLDHLRRPVQLDTAANDIDIQTPQLGQRISSVATLVLSLIIPMVTMGLVWPWTGPAASATLAPYLVGIVVQFAFEQYAKYRKSPSRSAIPFVFQVYRLHQLNRAAQLVTALSFTVRGAEMTSHNLAINSSLGTLLNVLQFLGVICIWSLSSYIMRFIPSVLTTTQ
ncbi:putative transmembrane protein [Senna tora]|uniref:Putative transmembrane protein n=1 Tax=Senna tora TaxID=362788 RepID=A0A834SLE7_9FABA|nr:putative transmembrane protein [Senna tora]